MLKKLKFLMVLAAVFAVAGCKAEVTEEDEVVAETPKYTITYDAAGHGTAPDAKTVEEGYKLTEADLPALTADGFDFGGWKFNEKIVAAGEEVVSDMTLIAAWTEWGTVATPTFSVAAGEVDKGTKVKITCTTEGAVIYYTIDGSAPTAGSTKYESEIEITAATTIKAFAVKSGMKDSTVAEVIYTVDVTPPANVTNLTAKCTASQTVKLTWTNPTDSDFAKVVITYEPGNGNVTVAKSDSPNNEATIEGLTDGTEYTFTVKAYDTAENENSGVSVKCKLNGGLIGTPTNGQSQGAILKDTLKASWMADNGNLKFGETEIAKTSEVVVIPTGTVATVTMPDDSCWSDYIEKGADSYFKGVFLKDRKIKLDPFVMSQYQVTEQLWGQVMGETATDSIKPKEFITWYQACAFCNELTKKTMTEADCVYYSDEGLTHIYEIGTSIYAAYDTSTKKWTKKGYRLPTEAEWEFAARGGDPNAQAWKYAYSGVNSSGMVKDRTKAYQTNYDSTGFLNIDDNLSEYAVYYHSGAIKADVGTKKANNLNLYDMSGNVYEWCYDWYNDKAGSNDGAYTVDGYVQNPLGSSSGDHRVLRGGGYSYEAYYCSVSYRYYYDDNLGFRVCRSTETN